MKENNILTVIFGAVWPIIWTLQPQSQGQPLSSIVQLNRQQKAEDKTYLMWPHEKEEQTFNGLPKPIFWVLTWALHLSRGRNVCVAEPVLGTGWYCPLLKDQALGSLRGCQNYVKSLSERSFPLPLTLGPSTFLPQCEILTAWVHCFSSL